MKSVAVLPVESNANDVAQHSEEVGPVDTMNSVLPRNDAIFTMVHVISNIDTNNKT